MPTLKIHGCDIIFPFDPYKCQRDYMDKVISALHNGSNAILESPTGTGKTLSLLCSVLAWQDNKRKSMGQIDIRSKTLFNDKTAGSKRPPYQIYYLSRTHSQLKQVVKELKKTAYTPKMTIIGSREHLCIQSEVQTQKTIVQKNQMCKKYVKHNACRFYRPKDTLPLPKVFDIEDAFTDGRSCQICPFYYVRSLSEEADLILMPYNYLIDAKNRKSNLISIENSIIIIDEAHNLDQICEESYSTHLKISELQQVVEQLNIVISSLNSVAVGKTKRLGNNRNKNDPPDVEQVKVFKNSVLNLKNQIHKICKNSSEIILSNQEAVNMLTEAKFASDCQNELSCFVERILEFLSEIQSDVNVSPLVKVSDFINCIMLQSEKAFKDVGKYFQLCITPVLVKNSEVLRDIELNYWCFAPFVAIQDIISNNCYSMIFTSGTLSPLTSFESDLRLKNSLRLENPHIIENNRLKLIVLAKYRDLTPLISTFVHRSNEKYLTALGSAILELISNIPGGVLVFFPSYNSLEVAQQFWRQQEIWDNFSKYKKIFVESKNSEIFNRDSKAFCSQASVGSMFFAVCRAKMSEGFDFADDCARAVIITGLPYPSKADTRVNSKIDTLNKVVSDSGRKWYNQEAMKSVNQAIGRVIRHRLDYGLVFLLDSRFQNYSIRGQLCKWTTNFIENHTDWDALSQKIRSFFLTHFKPVAATPPNNKRSYELTTSYDSPNIFNMYKTHKVLDKENKESSIFKKLKRQKSLPSATFNFNLKSYDNEEKSKKDLENTSDQSVATRDRNLVIVQICENFKKSLTPDNYTIFNEALLLYLSDRQIFNLMNSIENFMEQAQYEALKPLIDPQHLATFHAYMTYKETPITLEVVESDKPALNSKCCKCSHTAPYKLPCGHFTCSKCLVDSAYNGNKCIRCKKSYSHKEINETFCVDDF